MSLFEQKPERLTTEQFKAALHAQQSGQLEQALQIYQTLLTTTSVSEELAWQVYANLTQLWQAQKESVRAKMCFERATHILQALHRQHTTQHCRCSQQLSQLHFQQALSYRNTEPTLYLKHLKISWEILKNHGTARTLAEYYLSRNDLNVCRHYLSELEELLRQKFKLPYAKWCADQCMHLKDYAMAQRLYTQILAKGTHLPDYEKALLQLQLAATYPKLPAYEAFIKDCYRKAERQHTALEFKLAKLCYFPAVYESAAQIKRLRQDFKQQLDTLLAMPVQHRRFTQAFNLQRLPFYLPYQQNQGDADLSDKELIVRFGRIVKQGLPKIPAFKAVKKQPTQKEKIRVGCVSRFFYTHSIMRCFAAFLMGLNGEPFEWVGIEASPLKHDELTQQLKASACKWHVLTGTLTEQCEQIRALDVDILIYTDTLLDPHTYLLSHYRLAAVQALLSGQPVTSGVDTLDYFISDAFSESAMADSHYSEQLIRLALPPSVYRPPLCDPCSFAPLSIPDYSRKALKLPEGTLYICAAQTHKLHPDMDLVFRDILAQDPTAQLILIAFQPELVQALNKRFFQSMPHTINRIHWLKPLPQPKFLALLKQSAVMLESFPFGSGNTIMSALQAQLPVLALQQEALKGRYAMGIYAWAGIAPESLVSSSFSAYAKRAVQLAHDAQEQKKWRETLRTGQSRVFNNTQSLNYFRHALLQIANCPL